MQPGQLPLFLSSCENLPVAHRCVRKHQYLLPQCLDRIDVQLRFVTRVTQFLLPVAHRIQRDVPQT